ncbi:MAG: polysaccharide biosynthesis protein [Bryobacterales bacterium]|nr:polysaccharide biosynthesis protein [Bryobacterales bacterium]
MHTMHHHQNTLLHMLVCAGAVSAGVWIAYLLRFDLQIPPGWLPGAVYASVVCVAIQAPLLWLMGWRRVGWHGISLPDLAILARMVAAAAGTSSAVLLLARWEPVPRSVPILQGATLMAIAVLARLGVRLWRERQAGRLEASAVASKRVFLYGAGFAGQALSRALLRYPELGYLPVGFVDDNEALHGEIVHGLPVVTNGVGLCTAVERHSVGEILIAIPSASPETLRRLRTYCDQAGRPCKAVPGLAELLQRPERLTELRHLDMADLLGRSQISLDEEGIRRKLSGQVVMVTGAAGSIGSELCRQLVRFRPQRILALDVAETPLFELENEFRERYPCANMLPVIGDVRHERRLFALLVEHSVDVVFHAAAYKHVPMMERHVAMAIENNVLGTYALASAAEQAGVRDVVMISTDKAVRPSSVMGATKRLAEMVVKSRSGGAGGSGTRFVSVRFGNVLGSNGSVIPIFRRQIASGGPVTVTHPEMRRYFMTIPEASRLVLQAMAMGERDEIFVLDMGNPVRIDDLARNLIRLHGLRPGRDIAVEYTGPRPGEKLFEELYLHDEDLVRTVHEKIMVLQGPPLERDWVDERIRDLRALLLGDPEQLRAWMAEMIPDYAPVVTTGVPGGRERAGSGQADCPFPRKLLGGDNSMDALEWA